MVSDVLENHDGQRARPHTHTSKYKKSTDGNETNTPVVRDNRRAPEQLLLVVTLPGCVPVQPRVGVATFGKKC